MICLNSWPIVGYPRTMPNGITPTFEYDNMSRLKRLKHQSSAATLFDNQYTYNSANQISGIIDLVNTRVFGYDLVDRLTSVHTNGTQTESYGFDDVGNRSSSHLSATYGYQSGKFNQLTSTATASFQFDSNGNTIQKSEGSNFWRYVWDYENRLVEASTRKEKARYKYDALGRRVERNLRHSKERTRFTHDGLDVVMDSDAETGVTKYQNGLGIDDKLKLTNAGNPSYFLQDHLGSTVGLANSSALDTSSNTYDSFGNPTGNLATRFLFTGREYDHFTGLQFSRARFYDPKIGRFTSEDPIGFGGGDINLYGYVRNQPLRFRDSLGLYPAAEVWSHPATWQTIGASVSAAGAAIGAGIGIAASSPAVVAGAGFGVGFAIGYYPGQWTANHPSNPFVHGPWPLNPFKPPFGYPVPVYPAPTTESPTSQPYCKPVPRAIPFFNWPPEEYPIPLGPYPPQTPELQEKCYEKCKHFLGIGDYGVKYNACYRRCTRRIS